jgi:iron complex transport system substrate-binding protein
MSTTTFRRRFKHLTGMPPHRYRLACRVAEARRLLGSSDAPIKQIADELGYTDVFYFSRHFKQMTGVSPAHYRRSSLYATQS